MAFHRNLSNSKSLQVFRTLLSILAVLHNAGFLWVFTRPPTSKSSRPLNNYLVTVPSTNHNWYNFRLYVPKFFFQFPRKVEVLFLLFILFQFYSVVSRVSEVDDFAISLFFGGRGDWSGLLAKYLRYNWRCFRAFVAFPLKLLGRIR